MNGTRAALWASLGLLLLALAVASGAAAAGMWLIWRVAPGAPAYYSILIGTAVLVAVLAWMAHRYRWLMPWYYLLPAILFLITFTLLPIILTVYLAFTDYAGRRNTQLNPTTETAIVGVEGGALHVASAAALQCGQLHNGCDGVRARLFATGEFETAGVSLDGTTLVLEEALPGDRQVSAVALEMTDFGFEAQFPVVEVDGRRVELGRAPPGAVNLDRVTLELQRISLERRIVAIEGDTLILDEPLTDELQYTAIARYNDYSFIGLENFRDILARASRSLFPVFAWNVSFATLTVLINIVVGVLLAVLLNNPQLSLRNLYRTLLIIPWALPAVITIQIWQGLLNYNFGAINRLLGLLGLPAVDWLGDPLSAKSAVLLVNLWLSYPFMMVATLGALSAIPAELYEAARMDGASAWQGFRRITLPLLRHALVPVALTSFALSFNNFNVIFLLTDGGPAYAGGTSTARATDILISWAYNEAFRSQGGFAYGLGSAISILIFILTLAVSLVNFKVTGALNEEAAR